ncbi:hypothetical protein RA19_17200 [Leisingera sp. ANG-M1]|uniref:sulfotransferase-like domain-containing protein n=1 Tax=Leisingera sp. ANG-M1 TaxID=1577895 RepID=UPI00057F0D02|nr:sulfotransferase family protein [Leisingera sp. ANG-M1]KIC09027.1 hypothetical protein RA19_17200 [Leisingera sp. ANG-M1]
MNKIIALWSHPRSMSTAMERVMRERGDLDCAHEPFMYDYYVSRQVRRMPHFDVQPGHPVSYEAIRDMLLERAEQKPVFFKDMSYYVMPRILQDAAFRDRLVNCFLIRNPIASIPSYYKLDPDLTLEEIGLEAQWRHYTGLKQAGHDPLVIEAEAVRSDTRGTLARMWEKIGLEFSEAAFDWQNENPKDWQQVDGWHGDVSSSRAIRPLTLEEIAGQERKFFALARKEPRLLDYLEHHLPYYLRLKGAALGEDPVQGSGGD